MKSNINLYADSKILIDKNFHVDSISDYLNTLTKLSLTQLNYIVPKKEMKLKLELSQDFVELGNSGKNNYNYAFLWDTINSYFYFIRDFKWISQSVVELDLYMDTINTFTFKNQGELPQSERDYVITPKTLIHRQHKDRWSFNAESTPKLSPIIDKINEGINPVLYKGSDEVIEDDVLSFKQKWYLVYKNRNAISETDFNQVNPVDIFIYPEKDTPIAYDYKQHIPAIYFNAGYTYFSSRNGRLGKYCPLFYNADSGAINEKLYEEFGTLGGHNGVIVYWFKIYKSNGMDTTFTYIAMKSLIDENGDAVYHEEITRRTGVEYLDFVNPPDRVGYYYSQNDNNNYVLHSSMYSRTSSFTSGTAYSISRVDRTDSKLIKIIELPYCPLPISYRLSTPSLAAVEPHVYFNTTEHALYLEPSYLDAGSVSPRYHFEHKVDLGGNLFPLNIGEVIQEQEAGELYSDEDKNPYLETKLASSEFYLPKIIYDSFSMPIKWELTDFDEFYNTYMDDQISLIMITPTTITSKFGFSLEGVEYTLSEEDYPLFLPVARNNEDPIYTSQYINYLRTGFNYDLKAKNQQAAASGIGIGLATLGAVAGLGIGIGSSNPAVAFSSVVSSLTAVTSAVSSAINTAITNQRAIEQRLAQAKAQAVSIQASDDIDLLNAYANGNKAKICHYKPSEVMTKNIFDLFYYTGYTIEKLGLPDTTSRMRFNYVSADIDILTARHLTKDIIEDIKARWSLGITFIHKLSSDITRYPYDFEQELENWEWSLEDAIEISE